MTTRLLTSGELAAELGVSTQSIARWAREGIITPASVTAGGHYRWDLQKVKSELEAARGN